MIEMNNKKEHILVCLSSSPSNPKVIHTAAKMAKVFDAEFTALYIEPLNPEKLLLKIKKDLMIILNWQKIIMQMLLP